MLFQVAALLVREWTSREWVMRGVDTATARQLSAWVGFAMLGLLAGPLLLRNSGALRQAFAWPEDRLRIAMVAVAIGISMRIMSWAIVFVLPGPGNHSLNPGMDGIGRLVHWQCPDPGLLLLAVCTLAIATPLLEETFHRGLILCELLRSGQRYALPTSAILFAVLHRPDDLAVAFAFGMVAGTFFINCRSLWGPVIAHATFNGISLIDSRCLQLLDLELYILAMPATMRCAASGSIIALFLWFALRLARAADAGG